MPRARKQPLTDPGIKDEALPGLDHVADPKPARRGPGRPRKAASTGNQGRIPARTATGRIASRQAVANKVAGELYAILVTTTTIGLAAGADPCLQELLEYSVVPGENGPQEVQRLEFLVYQAVQALSHNDAAMEFLSKAGFLSQIAITAQVAWPIAKAIFQAHGPSGHGHKHPGQGAPSVDLDQYAAPALT